MVPQSDSPKAPLLRIRGTRYDVCSRLTGRRSYLTTTWQSVRMAYEDAPPPTIYVLRVRGSVVGYVRYFLRDSIGILRPRPRCRVRTTDDSAST